MTRVAEVLDDLLLGLPLTPGAVDVLEGRQRGPGDAFSGPPHLLESHVVEGGSVAVSGGDAAR